MDALYINAADKDVAAYYIYADGSDGFAYSDKSRKNKMTTSELKNAFLKGAVIVIEEAFYKPVNMTISANVATVVYITNSDSTATAASVKSVEDPEE